MDDFTKEELIMLKRLTLQHVNQFRQNSDCIELMSKILSMIDNYCDHELEDWALTDNNQKICIKCEKLIHVINT